MLTLLVMSANPPEPVQDKLVQKRVSLKSASSAATGVVFSLGAATVALGVRIIGFGASLWLGLALLRGAIAVVGLNRRLPASSQA